MLQSVDLPLLEITIALTTTMTTMMAVKTCLPVERNRTFPPLALRKSNKKGASQSRIPVTMPLRMKCVISLAEQYKHLRPLHRKHVPRTLAVQGIPLDLNPRHRNRSDNPSHSNDVKDLLNVNSRYGGMDSPLMMAHYLRIIIRRVWRF